ncbi:MAG: cell division protein ZapE [Xanthomonadales bacterium]|nr:cell division protein ZapE [Xanthomonadales bacterium]
MNPSAAYQREIDRGQRQEDAAQRALLPVLDRIHAQLLARAEPAFAARFLARFRTQPPVRGLYLHGGVGRGKTFLIDLLHDTLPVQRKLRLHFHRFMGRIHESLRSVAGEADPLQRVARQFAREAQLFCLDEFFVTDIGDAMILGEFLQHLFAAGATLVTTSNLEPRRLYEHGLQRERFLPAIALLERHCEVLPLASTIDYRLRALTRASVYWTPDGGDAEAAMASMFAALAPGDLRAGAALRVHDRDIAVRRLADGLAWFDFAALCEGPRAVADYIEIARSFQTVFVSAVPQFDASQRLEDAAKRFIHLVDEFYDRNVNLVLAAAAVPTALYCGQRHRHEFERTASRLIEMQSRDYLAREHKP